MGLVAFTVMLTVAVFLPSLVVTVMVVFPAFLPTIFPLASIVATLVLDDFQVTPLLLALDGLKVALTVVDFPTVMVLVGALILTLFTATFFACTVIFAFAFFCRRSLLL